MVKTAPRYPTYCARWSSPPKLVNPSTKSSALTQVIAQTVFFCRLPVVPLRPGRIFLISVRGVDATQIISRSARRFDTLNPCPLPERNAPLSIVGCRFFPQNRSRSRAAPSWFFLSPTAPEPTPCLRAIRHSQRNHVRTGGFFSVKLNPTILPLSAATSPSADGSLQKYRSSFFWSRRSPEEAPLSAAACQ